LLVLLKATIQRHWLHLEEIFPLLKQFPLN
jgi:hypothetical protein